jgi:hypothetical protein
MFRALSVLAARPALRGYALAVFVSVLTIVLLEFVRRAIEEPVEAPGALLAIAVIASLAGMGPGLLGALLFAVYGLFVYAENNQPPNFGADGALRASLLALTGLGMALLVGVLKARDDQRRVLELVRAAEARQRMVTATSADAIVTIDDDSTILFANAATGRIFGYPMAALRGTSLTRLMPEALRAKHVDALTRYVATMTPSRSWHAIELVGRRADGSEFPVEVSFAEFVVDGRHTFTGTIRDISERKRMEAQLVESQRMEAVGRMAGAIAHDFNNILTAVNGYATLVRDQLAPNDPARADVDGIQHAAEGATSLVRQLLAFSRRQVLHPQVLDPCDAVDEILPMIERLIGENVTIEWRRPATPAHAIEVDPTQLGQVILNLALNARDAMPDGGTLTIEVEDLELDEGYARTHLEAQPGPHVMLAVSDTGTGMDRETVQHVFEPFFTTKGAGQGTGLGLATVYGIVKQSRGSLAVYSEPGYGSTFRVFLPHAAGEAVRTPAGSEPGTPVGGTERILVAEDEESVRELVRTLLRRFGYEVLVAHDGPSAVELASRERIDLLLTDVIMPGLGGPEVARRVRELQPDARVLFMSGYTAGAIDRQSLIEHGAALLQKPFTPAVLASAVRRALADAALPGDMPSAGDSPATPPGTVEA